MTLKNRVFYAVLFYYMLRRLWDQLSNSTIFSFSATLPEWDRGKQISPTLPFRLQRAPDGLGLACILEACWVGWCCFVLSMLFDLMTFGGDAITIQGSLSIISRIWSSSWSRWRSPAAIERSTRRLVSNRSGH